MNATNPASFNSSDLDLPTIDVKALFYRLLANWYWLLLGLLAGGLVAWLQLRYAVPEYLVKAELLIKDENSMGGFTEDQVVAEFGFENRSKIENEIQMLRSRTLMQRVIDSLGFQVTYHAEGRLKSTENHPAESPFLLADYELSERNPIRTLSITAIDTSAFELLTAEDESTRVAFGEWFSIGDNRYRILHRRSYVSNYPYRITVFPVSETANRYLNKLQIRILNRSDVLELSLRDEVPLKAADILNQLIATYNEVIIEDKNTAGQKTLSFINERLDFVARELFDVEGQVERFKQGVDVPLNVAEKAERYLEQLSDADREIAEINLQLGLLEQLSLMINVAEDSLRQLPIVSEVVNPTLGALLAQYNSVVQEYEDLLQAATPNNPVGNRYLEQLQELKQQVDVGLSTMQRELATRRTAIQDRLAPIERQVRSIPSNERQLIQIMRQQQIKENLFLFLLQRREETALGLAAQVANSRSIDPAINTGQVSPDRNMIWLISLAVGVLIPTILIFLLFYLDNKVRSERDIKQMTQAPFLGWIPFSKSEENIVVFRSARTGVAEAFRLLRTNLQFVLADVEKPTILISSAVSGEGKSFVTINLGTTFALAGKKVCIVGLDLRKPKMARYLGAQSSMQGVSTVLIGSAVVADLIQTSLHNEHLHYIPAGPKPPNPAELILGDRMGELFAYLKEHYDAVLVDTAPLGLVTDALLLKDHVDAALFVSNFGSSRKVSLKLIEDIYQNKKLPRPGVLLNGVKEGGGYGYGYGGYGYGGYGYGYYSEDNSKKQWWKFWG